MRPAVRRLPVAVAVVLVLALSGCVRLPDEGPVVEAGLDGTTADHPAGEYDPPPPQDGASRQAVVSGFLDAMTGWPNQTNVAKQFLTREAAEEWNPEASTIVYADALPAQEVGGVVSVELTDADRLDASRAWRGSLRPDELTLGFQLALEDGEFRIVDPPDALVVPAPWFQQRFQQVALYYFDPTLRILVPEPVFVPEGEQLATSLVSALLAGPSASLDGVVRTLVPEGLDEGLSVPVTDEGVAEVTLAGDAGEPSAEEAELMLAQFAWTLSQDPEVSAVRVTIGGEAVPVPGGGSEYDVVDADAFDPAGASATAQLFALRRGRVVSGGPGAMTPITGPFGRRDHGLVDLAVAPRGDRAVGVLAGRAAAVVAPVDGTIEGEGQVRTVVDSAADLARPSWDYAGRLWLLDRRPGGAAVQVIDRGRAREVHVPEVSGEDARRLLVSRDGTRLVAVVRDNGADRLVISRVSVDSTGRVERVAHSTVTAEVGGVPEIVDVAWSSPSTITVLTPASPGLFEIDTVVADGASVGTDTLSTIVRGRVRGLAASADEELVAYAVLRDSLIDLREQTTAEVDVRLRAVDYAG